MEKICKLDSRVLVKISGEDSERFLQSQITNDIRILESEKIIYTLFVNSQGRFLFDSFIIKDSDGYLLEINKHESEKFIKRMSFYKLRSKVDFSQLENYQILYSKTNIDLKSCYKDPRHPKLGYRIYDNFEITSFSSENIYLKDKYHLGIPDGFTDMIPEKTLVPEFHIDKLNGVSYNKGCFTGQEIISRTKNLGVVRKKPYILEFEENVDLLDLEKNLYAGDVKIGKITSIYKNKAIAILNINEASSKSEGFYNQVKYIIKDPDLI